MAEPEIKPVLSIFLFGPFEVKRGSELFSPSAWRNQQTRLLCRVLAMHQGHVVTSDRLLELLWPAADPDSARRRLHVRMSELRRLLDPDDPAAFIRTVSGGYLLDCGPHCWVDVHAFEASVDRGQSCQDAGDLAGAIAAYEEARALYRGELLEQDIYADWALAERERLRERYLTALSEVAECYARQGRYRRAMSRCQQVLAADPCREAVHVRLMLYHYYAGERAQALRVFQRCRRLLADELALQPLPATSELADQIRNGTLWAVEGAPRYPPPAYAGRLFEVPYSLGRPPFAGREREYAWLVAHWQDPASALLLVKGEAGVGKSRLVHEFLGYAGTQRATVLTARTAVRPGLAYAPIVAALRECRPDWGDVRLEPATLAAVANLLPEIRQQRDDLPALPELPAELARERLQRAIEALVGILFSADDLFFLDDAHAADAATLQLLLRLSDRLTIVFCCRSDQLGPAHPLAALLRPLRRDGRLAELQLERLEPAAVAGLLQQLAGREILALPRQLYSQTDGNPLFLLSALQNLFEQGVLYVDAGGCWSVTEEMVPTLPATIRESINERLGRLELAERRVLDLIAVAGGEFDFDLLQRAGRFDEDLLLDLLDRLIQAGLLVEPRRPGGAEFALTHNLYAQVAYETLPAVRRRRHHRRLAEALEATAPDLDATAAALASHWQEAADPVRAFDWLLRAGDVALARYARRDALDFFQQALALAAGEVAPVLSRLGVVSHHLARFKEGMDYHARAAARWAELGDDRARVQALFELAECCREASRYDRAVAAAQEGLTLAAMIAQDGALQARGHIILSNALRSGQLAPAETVVDHLQRALALARPLGARQLIGEATFWLGVVAINRGDAAGALVHDREALAEFRATGRVEWEAIALNNLAFHALLAGQPELGHEMAGAGLALARRVGAVNAQGWLLSTLGEVQTMLGRLDEAETTLQEGLALVTRWGPPRLIPGFLADLARVALARERWQEALDHLGHAKRVAAGDAPQFVPRLQVLLSEAYLGVGQLAVAEQSANAARRAAAEKGQRGVEGGAWRVLGAIHAGAGRPEAATEAFKRSLALLEALDDPLEAARTRWRWGSWLTAGGGVHGLQMLEAARTVFAACGATIDLERVERDLTAR